MRESELSAVSTADDFHPLMTSVPLRLVGAILHVGRSKVYDLLGEGKLKAVKDGTRVMVLIDSIKAYQASLRPAMFARPKPSRLENLDRLHAKQREERAKRRAERRRSKARA